MLVFIDESGCPGFKIAKGSDPIFVVGMVIFKNGAAAASTQAMIEGLHSELRHRSEFKFSKCDSRVRDGFFEATSRCSFCVRALVVRKQAIYSEKLRHDNETFYNYFVQQLMQFDNGSLMTARVRIDGSGDREFRRALGTYLRRKLGTRIRDIKLTDSKSDPLIQLADMCVGAIARSYRDRTDASRWRDMLAPRIEDIWEFK